MLALESLREDVVSGASRRVASRRVRRSIALVSCALTPLVAGCRKEPPPPAADEAQLALERVLEGGLEDASGARQRAIDERVAEARRDAGLAARESREACEGVSLPLLGAAYDERCIASEREYLRLARAATSGPADAGGRAGGLRQEARIEGGRIEYAIVNGSSTTQAIPIRARSSAVPAKDAAGPGGPGAFSVLADDGRGSVFELAEPVDEIRDAGTGLPGVHTAIVRLLPGGRATVVLSVDPRVVARLTPDRSCDGGPCTPARLPAGHYTLHVGQLLTEIDTGPPAQVPYDVP